MTDSISRDELFQKYENAKDLIKSITDAFEVSFQDLHSALQIHGDDQHRQLKEELLALLHAAKTKLEPLLTTAHSEDPGLFSPTTLQQQIKAFETQKADGIALVNKQKQQISTLQSTIETLKQEKKDWGIREAKGTQLIDSLKAKVEQLQNGNVAAGTGTKPMNGMIADNQGYDNTNVCGRGVEWSGVCVVIAECTFDG